jgi:hypothetical protein
MKRVLLLLLILSSYTSFAQDKPNLDEIDDACVLVKIFDYKGRGIGHGSGFFIDSIGTVVTNYHVVDKGTSFKVIRELDNGAKVEYDVEEIISGDEGIDIATIKVDIPKNTEIPYLSIAQEIPSKGDDCWAIGAPAQEIFMNTVSNGIISNFHINGIGPWKGSMIQTTAEIAGGSSGGALVNSKGDVIGVMCGIYDGEGGARASINLAISIKEIENLDKIEKENLIKPSMIPCEIAFYTNDKYTGDAYLYVDKLFVGKLTKFFLNNVRPECGQEGTITRSVFQGTHTWQVYYSSTGRWYYGTFEAQPGGCFRVKVNQDSYYGGGYTWFQPRERTKIDDKNLYRWGIYSGLSFTQTGRRFPLAVYVERSFFESEFSLRGHIHWLSKSEEQSTDYTYSTKYFGLGLDAKKLFIKPYRWDWSIGAFGYFRSLKEISDYIDYDYTTWPETEIVVNNVDNWSHLFAGVRFGGDCYLSQRLYFTMDMGLGYRVYFDRNNVFGSDLNLLLGYRF